MTPEDSRRGLKMPGELVVAAGLPSTPAAEVDLSEYGVASAIAAVTQYLKPCFPETLSRVFPLFPFLLALGWTWAEQRAKHPVINWPLVVAKAFRLFIISVGVYAVGKQAVKKETPGE